MLQKGVGLLCYLYLSQALHLGASPFLPKLTQESHVTRPLNILLSSKKFHVNKQQYNIMTPLQIPWSIDPDVTLAL
jgi:hypothetical protein